MTFQINIQSSGHSFQIEPQESILEAALRQGLQLPYGCRNGACGSCKGEIIAGEIEHGLYQPSTLSLQEKTQGIALFCCATAKSNLTIECKETQSAADLRIRKLPCRVERMERVAPDVMILSLKLPHNERLQFLAGQYIDIRLKDGQRRSFSLANAPYRDGFLQLHIRHIPGGLFTDHVFQTMSEREILRLEGPFGSFYLRESEKPIIFIAGGTGFGPIKSIIEEALHQKVSRPMVLYWGARQLQDLYLAALPGQWQSSQGQNFSFIPVLSDPSIEDHWLGRTGLVHQAVMADFPDLSGYQVYACGSPAMIEAAKVDLIGRCSLSAAEFYADSFTLATQKL